MMLSYRNIVVDNTDLVYVVWCDAFMIVLVLNKTSYLGDIIDIRV